MIEKLKERRRDRGKRSRQRRKRQTRVSDAQGHPSGSISDNGSKEPTVEQAPAGSMLLAHAIRATGILPIVVLISILLTHHFYATHIPRWFHPIVQQDVAVLTLCAGHAGIVGISIGLRRVRNGWSTYALAIAAFATAGAGYRAIGEDLAGHVVILSLFILLIPSIWAESISKMLSNLGRFARTRKGRASILLFVSVPLIIYNQIQNENYIRNWIVIPLLVILGILITTVVLWLLLKLVRKYLPSVFLSAKRKPINTSRRLIRKARPKAHCILP